MITVLVADDSFLMRKLISDMLSGDPEIKVVGTASNGEQAIEMARQLLPDVITMDLDMPRLDGLSATRRIMNEAGPRSIVIMLSAFTRENADVTLACLRAGAFDCVMKPSGALSLNINIVKSRLIAQVKAAAHARGDAVAREKQTAQRSRKKLPVTVSGRFPLIVIGTSTGGPPVLEQIFTHLEGQLSAAILIVQHMPAMFTRSLAERLDRVSPIKVKQAEEGEIIKPGMALIAPGDRHMIIRRSQKNPDEYQVHLTDDAPVHGLKPSIDVLMQSVAREFNGSMVSILLTGMGEDGQAGMAELKRRGSRTIVQDPATCVVDSMVDGVIAGGNADEILAPEKIAQRIVALSQA